MIQVVITLLVVGLLLALMEWATAQIPSFPAIIKKIVYVVVIVCVVLWLLQVFGVLGSAGVPVPRL